ncbi:PcfK-like family protein [Bacteroides fragilis]
MKGTELFKAAIQNYLEYRAMTDYLFAPRYANPAKNIDDCIIYILNEVQKSGMNGFDDDEIYSMAMHYYDEDDIEIGKPISCNVMVNHHVELTEEEKQNARRKAIEQYQQMELNKLQSRAKQKSSAPQTTNVQPSLFDF